MTALCSALRAAIRDARSRHRPGSGSVLELAEQALSPSLEAGSLCELVWKCCGVFVLSDASALAPDFSLWSAELARRHRSLVLKSQDGKLYAVSEDPWNEALLQQMSRSAGAQLDAAAASTTDIAAWLKMAGQSPSPRHPSAPAAIDGPVVRFVDQALAEGFKRGASDVHFECDRSGVSVKHRLDGVMVAHARLPDAASAREVISRIKVLAKLDITERRVPQDGRFRFAACGLELDLRVSVMPSIHGEDAVLRLLDKAQSHGPACGITLNELGFDAGSASTIRALAARPSGMLLVTGPTGSGKTTTVYAALSEINTGSEKLITIEDPVEYELPGVLQIPVHEAKGLTFAKGLRSILRHDPDRILVGEIRDAETAGIAVQSALTGHLVFTTVHANSMADVVGRFRHFDLDMFGFMSALNGVVVQRLLRRLCPACARQRRATPQEREWLSTAPGHDFTHVAEPVGCADCHGSGYKGRFVLAEVHLTDDSLRDRIAAEAPISVLKAHAAERGVVTLKAQALAALAAGRTTIDEIRRVVGEA